MRDVGPLPRRSVGAALVPCVTYIVMACVFTWPLVLHPIGRFAAGPGVEPDPFLNLWILGWDLRTLTHTPLAVLSGRVFDANIFYPARTTLAYSDHFLLQAAALWPLFGVFKNLVICYNALFFCSLVLSALTMHWFAGEVTGSRPGAYAAGTIWGFWPYRFAHLIHLQLQALYWMPLTFLFLYRLARERRRRDAALLGITAALQAACSIYYGVIGVVALAIAAAVLCVVTDRGLLRLLVRRLLLAAVVGALIVLPFAWPYFQLQRREGFVRDLYQAAQHEATVAAYLQVPAINLVYGTSGLLGTAPPSRAGIRSGPEEQLFPGFLATALAALGFAAALRRGPRRLAVALAAVGVAGFLLSLGPDGARHVYAWLYDWVFGFQAIRAPARFGVLVAFAVAVLAAFGTAEAGRLKPALAAAAVALVGLEYLNAPIRYQAVPVMQTAVGEWLRAAPEPGSVLYLPIGFDAQSTPFMIESLEHGRPIVNGYSGQRPPFYSALVETLRSLPSADALWTLHDLSVRFVVSPTSLATRDQDSPLVERAHLDGRIVYEMRWTPEIAARLVRPEPEPPPPMGPPPFPAGEKAVYQVSWVGRANALNVPAGLATFTVDRASRQGYQLDLTVDTADWVARFFEAHDRFQSWSDGTLLSEREERHLQEGRRVLERAVVFDHIHGVVKAGTGREAGVPLPLTHWARDPLTALYYARTLALTPGTRARIPVTDLGREMIAELEAGAVESILYRGARVEAARLNLKLVHRIEQRPPFQIAVWMSRDARRIPLIMRIDADFGSFQAELVSYKS